VDDLAHRLNLGAGNLLKLSTQELEAIGKKLSLLNPVLRIEQDKLKLYDLARQIGVRLEHLLKLKEAGLSGLAAKLSALSPLNILGRGYSITFKLPEGAIISDAKFLKTGESIKTRLHKGEVISQVMEVNRDGGDKV
jgi:exodeoxyribonuclease VII large subunit